METPEAIFAQEIERIAPRTTLVDESTAEVARDAVLAKDVRAFFGRHAADAVMRLNEETQRFGAAAAAYRLGRAAADGTVKSEYSSAGARRVARDEAVKWFQLTRVLVAKGGADPESLVSASIGWEAFAEFHAENFPQAIALYLKHHQSGDPTAVNSLRFVMRRLLRDETWRKNGLGQKLANDPQARRVWTAWLLAHGDRGFGWEDGGYAERLAAAAQMWAELLHQAGLNDVPHADRFAWVAYGGGRFALAEDWVRLAPKESGAAEWIRGKLALRKGDLPRGEKHLLAAAGSPELTQQRTTILGEIGRVLLAQDRPVEAMEAWLEGGHWEDAAYLAERVLTLDELGGFLDRTSGAGAWAYKRGGSEERWWRPANPNAALGHLLARRLMRANRPDEAQKYFPEALRLPAGEYVRDVRAGFDLSQADGVRAAAFWRAAKAVHLHGLELLGTELEPDWAIWGGSFDMGSAATARREPETMTTGAFAVTGAELGRVAEHAVPEKRFHYRYRAAQLAWWAAALMPNDDPETAGILAEAGAWLKNRDPRAAKEFYQALVVRCGRTELGKAAMERRWFPGEAKPPDL